jgi:hypothetical protein
MEVTKRLLAIQGALDPTGAGVTFTLKSEGGEIQTFAASSDVFNAVLKFVLDLDQQVRQQASAAKRIPDPLYSSEGIEVLLDLRVGRAVLRVQTERGRSIQLELSEELLERLESKVPAVLAELRKHKRDQSH